MANRMFMAVIFMGLACVLVAVVVAGLTMADPSAATWQEVGQKVAMPILAIFIFGIVVLFLAYWLGE